MEDGLAEEVESAELANEFNIAEHFLFGGLLGELDGGFARLQVLARVVELLLLLLDLLLDVVVVVVAGSVVELMLADG